MSLGKIKTRAKEGVKELGTTQGLKRVAVNFGIGAALGVIVDLILAYVMINIIQPVVGLNATRIWGFSIFPNFKEINPSTQKEEYWMPYDDILMCVIAVVLLMSKKLWLVLGFFTGFYFSSYLGLYYALGLPQPTEIPA